MRSKRKEIVVCEWDAVKRIVFVNKRKIILIHAPEFYETATEIERLVKERGFDVWRLNTGKDDEYETARKLLKRYCL